MRKAYVVWYRYKIILQYGVFESKEDIETFVNEPVAEWKKINKGKWSFIPGTKDYPYFPYNYAAIEIPVRESGGTYLDGEFANLPPVGQR